MITDGKKWHYLALKIELVFDGKKQRNYPKESAPKLFRGITSKNNGNFYSFACLNSFCRKNVLKKHERLCDNHNYCHAKMPTEDNKILKCNHGEKSLKAPFTIYADLECLLIKEQSCQNNPEKSYTERKAKHEPSGYSLCLICSFNPKENKHDLYRGRDCIEKVCQDLKELATEIINYKEKSNSINR